tara:strand:+ start:1589 stop:2020 length:432 start_codon:yes stop_codon:yes gene_type:complete
MTDNRKYKIPFSELVDRLTVDQIKLLKKMDDKKGSLKEEIKDVMYDIDTIINDKKILLNSDIIRMIIILSQINLHIWNLKDKMSENKDDYDKNLKLAHQLNGIRNQIKNILLQITDELNQSSKRTNFETDGLEGWDFNIDDTK